MNQFYQAIYLIASGFAKIRRFALVQLALALLCSGFALAKAGDGRKLPAEKVAVPRMSGAGAGKENKATMPIQAFERVITGKVSSAKGEPLPGVTVLLKGTTTGTSTEPDGSFSLAIPGNTGALIFSFVGFQTREVAVPQSGNLQVVLEDDAKALEEVVVVGYGTQKKVSMTSAVSEVKGEDLVKRPVSNVAQALQGQAPGLTVLDQGGGPGKSKVSIRVRGITTLSGDNNPLVIVDGIEQRSATSTRMILNPFRC